MDKIMDHSFLTENVQISPETEMQEYYVHAEQKRKELIAQMAGGVALYLFDPAAMTFQVLSTNQVLARKYDSAEDLKSLMKKYIENDIYAPDRKKVREAFSVKALMDALDTKGEYVIRFRDISSGKPRWFELRAVRLAENEVLVGFADKDEVPSLLSLSFRTLDEDACRKEEARARLHESMEVIGGLASEYAVLYHVNLDTDEYVPYFTSHGVEEIKPMISNNPKFSDLAHELYNGELVNAEERKNLWEFYSNNEDLKEKLKDRKRLSLLFKYNLRGEPVWVEAVIIKCEDEAEEAHNVIVGFSNKDNEVKERTRRQQETEKANKLIDNIISKYNLAYSVNMTDDTFEVLRIDESIVLGEKREFEYFRGVKDFFLEAIIHPADVDFMRHEMDYATIRDKVKKKKTYSIEYRSLLGGVSSWNEMNVTYISGDIVAVSFALNDLEITKKHLEDRRFDEYFALFTIDLDTSMIKTIKAPVGFETAPIGEAVPYAEGMKRFARSCEGDARALFEKLSNINHLKVQFSADEKVTYEYKASKQGIDRWVDVTGYVILRHTNGTPALATLGFSFSDALATERYEFQSQLREAYSQVEEARQAAELANSSKTSFLFNMSHDIRTPMNAIIGFTNMAKKYIDEKDRVADYLDKIDTSGLQLLSLVNQVLEMARIESGKVEIKENPINIHEEFKSMVAVLQEQAQTNELELTHSIVNVRHDRVLADQARMSSITLNVVGNSLKYTPRGGSINLTLAEIPARKEGFASFVFTVEDTGLGMSEEYLKDLFTPFTREKSSTVSKIQGTGLGMSIVKELVDLMGGNIEVHSELGKGTRFDITIDFKIDTTGQHNIVEIKDAVKASLEGKKVLLVEDNELNREIALDILEEEGLIVEEAEDGTVAVDMMKEKGPGYYDFVLMDIQMPIMNGYEATKAIREMYPDEPIPIIALSANAFSEDREKSLAVGMNEHVAKPINVEILFKVLSRFA